MMKAYGLSEPGESVLVILVFIVIVYVADTSSSCFINYIQMTMLMSFDC